MQPAAVRSTRQLLERELTPAQMQHVTLINECHTNLTKYIKHRDVRFA
jgi:hypothetical protein